MKVGHHRQVMGKNDDTEAHGDGNPCIPGVDAIVEMEHRHGGLC